MFSTPVDHLKGICTDGAANMESAGKGFGGKIQKIYPNIVYQWCSSHRLNLVIETAIKTQPEIEIIFQMLHEFSVVMKDSHNRMLKWEESLKEINDKYHDVNLQAKPTLLLGTRWTSKHKGLNSATKNSSMFLLLFKCVHAMTTFEKLISRSDNTKMKQTNLLAFWKDYANIVLAHILNVIMNRLNTVTIRFQKNGLYIYDMIKEIYDLNKFLIEQNTDDKIALLVNNAVDFADEAIKKINEDEEISEENKIEKEHDTIYYRNLLSARIRIFLTKLSDEIHNRFFDEVSRNEVFFKEISYLSPLLFHRLDFSSVSLTKICELAAVDHDLVFQQLHQLAEFYISSTPEHDPDAEEHVLTAWNKVFKFICETENIDKFKELTILYKYLLSLPATEVKCERDFSHLRYIKTYYRNQMSDEYLENEMIIHLNQDILNDLNVSEIVDRLSKSSVKLKQLLTHQ